MSTRPWPGGDASVGTKSVGASEGALVGGDMEHHLRREDAFAPRTDEGRWPVLICLLGNFRVLQDGQAVATRSGGKAEALLSALALRSDHRATREALLDALWPAS